MTEQFSKMLAPATIRARVAFVLAVAENVLKQIQDTADRIGYTRNFLDACWGWERGEAVKGDLLLSYLERDDDNGLMHYPYYGRNEDADCWKTIVAAGYYTTWHTYRFEGEKILPEAVNEVDETQIDYLVSCAFKCSSFDRQLLDCLAEVCLTKYRATTPGELGEPVDRRQFFAS